ncbi:MAG: hypothetical protein ACLTMP_00245 [Eggerthella lenta]
MASTYRTIEELYRTTLVALSESPEAWKAFLESAGRNYKLPFPEQALVHAAPGRQGGVGIGALGCPVRPAGEARISRNRRVRSPGNGRLRYYFDVSDTAPGAPPARCRFGLAARSRRRPSSAPSMILRG